MKITATNCLLVYNKEQAAETINRFLKSSKQAIEIRFGIGYFISLKKHTTNKQALLEIHTSGYDETMPLIDAIEWIKWELTDREASRCFIA